MVAGTTNASLETPSQTVEILALTRLESGELLAIFVLLVVIAVLVGALLNR
jgi:hypothetical protein